MQKHPNSDEEHTVEYQRRLENAYVHLASVAIVGDARDVLVATTRSLGLIAQRRPDLSLEIAKLNSGGPMLRRAPSAVPVPVDPDTRLSLLRREESPIVPPGITWPYVVQEALDSVVREREAEKLLYEAGLFPTKSVLFSGPPGVGKTMAARWVARQLKRPLLTLDIASVMSSYLGKTGSNIRAVLAYAKQTGAVLLLDEFDSIAKRRDDSSDVGELKRLVTVLLQEVDEWPTDGLLLAATNHPELLDAAVWRRFERVVQFPIPGLDDQVDALRSLFKDDDPEAIASVGPLLAGRTFSDLARLAKQCRKEALLANGGASAIDKFRAALIAEAPYRSRMVYATELRKQGSSEREISRVTKISRDTLRKKQGDTC